MCFTNPNYLLITELELGNQEKLSPGKKSAKKLYLVPNWYSFSGFGPNPPRSHCEVYWEVQETGLRWVPGYDAQDLNRQGEQATALRARSRNEGESTVARGVASRLRLVCR